MYERVGPNMIGSQTIRDLNIPIYIKAQREMGQVPGMLSFAERGMLHALTSGWRGEGAIIDGGSFLGTSLVASSVGLRANPKITRIDLASFPDGKPVHGL